MPPAGGSSTARASARARSAGRGSARRRAPSSAAWARGARSRGARTRARASRRASGCGGARSRAWSRCAPTSRGRTPSPRRARERPRRRRRAPRAGRAASDTGPRRPRCLPTARSGRAMSPTNSESPVRRIHGSSPRSRSATAMQQCSGRWPGVCSTSSDDLPEEMRSPSSIGAERVVGPAERVRRDPGAERASPARRARRRGRRGCASR